MLLSMVSSELPCGSFTLSIIATKAPTLALDLALTHYIPVFILDGYDVVDYNMHNRLGNDFSIKQSGEDKGKSKVLMVVNEAIVTEQV